MNLADLMKLTTATLGDYAPAVRCLQIDYKLNGQNRHTDTVTLVSQGVTDAALVCSVREHIEAVGGRLSAVWETRENGGLPRCLYVIPGFLEESVREMGLSVPSDPVAAMERVGWNPVNLNELKAYWSGKRS